MRHRNQLIVRRLGRNLRAAREAAGLTQEQVARRMDLQVTQYARMEQGLHDTGVSRYVDAMWAIGMTPAALLHRLEERMP